MSFLISETIPKFTSEILRSAAKQSEGCHVIHIRLRREIKRYLREQEESHMRRKVLSLSQSLNDIKEVNLHLTASISKELVEDPLKTTESSKSWKIKSCYGDIDLKYSNEHTVAYVASRMSAVYSACYRVLNEVSRRLPGFSPKKVLDFGAGTGSAMWAVREVWPKSLERINLVEPSQSMQRVDLKHMLLIHSYDSIQFLTKNIKKDDREHDLVIASYVLGEIPSLQDRITIVRQLWNLTTDVLVFVEPGTPQGSNIISQKWRKLQKSLDESSKDLIALKSGAFAVVPCAHDGRCPLDNTGKYCHFVQRLERTTSQRAYKRSKGAPLRGFEDEKFCYVAFRKGQRPRDDWPLDGMKFETLKEQHANRNPEDLEIDYEDQFESETEIVPFERIPKSYDSDVVETDIVTENDDEEDDEIEGKRAHADLGSGWGRIIFSPMRRGKRVEMDVCRAIDREGSEGSFEHIVVTKSKNPILHHQARRTLWGRFMAFLIKFFFVSLYLSVYTAGSLFYVTNTMYKHHGEFHFRNSAYEKNCSPDRIGGLCHKMNYQ